MKGSGGLTGSMSRALRGRLGSILIAFLGLALVAGTGYGVYVVLEGKPRVEPVQTTAVVAVAQDVEERSLVSAAALRVVQVPVELVPAGAVTRLEDAEGKLAISRLMPGEILMKHRLTERTAEQGLAPLLQTDEIAITFPAAGIASVGWLLPGDRIDVLVTLRSPGASPLASSDPFTTVAIQDLRVLSVTKGTPPARQPNAPPKPGSQAPPPPPEFAPQVVLAVDYADALFLKSIKDSENVGVDLVLRPVGKREAVPVEGLTLMDGFRKRNVKVPESFPTGGLFR